METEVEQEELWGEVHSFQSAMMSAIEGFRRVRNFLNDHPKIGKTLGSEDLLLETIDMDVKDLTDSVFEGWRKGGRYLSTTFCARLGDLVPTDDEDLEVVGTFGDWTIGRVPGTTRLYRLKGVTLETR